MMEDKIIQRPTKSLYFTEDRFNIWAESIRVGLTSLYVTDSELSLTYYVADFDGCKYHVRNQNMFGKIIESCKKRPQVIRDLIKFHATCRQELDVIDDLKIRMSCFKRRFSVYTKKTINKTKRMI
jgi:hypothetical protein